MERFKVEKSIIPLGNLMLIYVFCQIVLFMGDYILLIVFKLRDEVLDPSGVDAKFSV